MQTFYTVKQYEKMGSVDNGVPPFGYTKLTDIQKTFLARISKIPIIGNYEILVSVLVGNEKRFGDWTGMTFNKESNVYMPTKDWKRFVHDLTCELDMMATVFQ